MVANSPSSNTQERAPVPSSNPQEEAHVSSINEEASISPVDEGHELLIILINRDQKESIKSIMITNRIQIRSAV